MKKHVLSAWSFAAAMALFLSACQSKTAQASPRTSSSHQESPVCQPPPTEGAHCEQECREEECDYEEAGEEAMIHVIEIESPDDAPSDASSASKEEVLPNGPSASNLPEATTAPVPSEEVQ